MLKSTSGYRSKVTKLKTANKRKVSSNKWLMRQLNDPFVAKAKIEGYRSRAAYKLLEINDKFKILKPGSKILDLGAAPGGWSQVASEVVHRSVLSSDIIALDLLDMDPLPGVTFIKKDFYDADAAETIINLAKDKVDVVLSDMAPNTIGHGKTDHLKITDLCSQSLDFALTILKPGGHFVAKIFKGGAENTLLVRIKQNFTTVKHFKPLSSRKESNESYIVALGRKSV
jgi:23S rRNA (uridine2552-2'-O)-methyltransferase